MQNIAKYLIEFYSNVSVTHAPKLFVFLKNTTIVSKQPAVWLLVRCVCGEEGEVPTIGLGKPPESLKGENNGLNEKIAGKLFKNASCLRYSKTWKALGFAYDVTDMALENLNTFTILTLILKLLVFIYCTLQALSRISPSTFFTSQAESVLKLLTMICCWHDFKE